MTDPISPAYRERMNELAHALDEILAPAGFALLVFDVNKPEGVRMSYISNARREDIVAAMKEFIARREGLMSDKVGQA